MLSGIGARWGARVMAPLSGLKSGLSRQLRKVSGLPSSRLRRPRPYQSIRQSEVQECSAARMTRASPTEPDHPVDVPAKLLASRACFSPSSCFICAPSSIRFAVSRPSAGIPSRPPISAGFAMIARWRWASDSVSHHECTSCLGPSVRLRVRRPIPDAFFWNGTGTIGVGPSVPPRFELLDRRTSRTVCRCSSTEACPPTRASPGDGQAAPSPFRDVARTGTGRPRLHVPRPRDGEPEGVSAGRRRRGAVAGGSRGRCSCARRRSVWPWFLRGRGWPR